MLEHGDLTEFEFAFSLEFSELLTSDSVVFEVLLGVGKEHSDGLSSSVDVEVVKFKAHIFYVVMNYNKDYKFT